MTIAKLARAGGVGVETVRYDQRRGLMPESERPAGAGISGGVRRYGVPELRRLRFIRSAKSAGFTLEEIGELIALDATDDRERARELARARISILDEKIAELEVARTALDQLANRCASARVARAQSWRLSSRKLVSRSTTDGWCLPGSPR